MDLINTQKMEHSKNLTYTSVYVITLGRTINYKLTINKTYFSEL
jgi:hypothetical protein